MENKEVIKIDVNVINDVLKYISQQPYIEVVKMINDIHNSISNNNKPDVKDNGNVE